MNRNLEQLQTYINNNQGRTIMIDGAIDYDKWNNSQPKILFLLKEAYGDENSGQKIQDLARSLNKEENSFDPSIYTRSGTWRRISMIKRIIVDGLYGKNGIGDFKDYINEEGNKIIDEVQSIAFVNIKKTMGESRSIDKEIKESMTLDNLKEISKQIKSLNPDIIIMGGTLRYFGKNKQKTEFFNENKIREDDNDNWIYWSNEFNAILVDFWHPSIIYTTRRFEELFLNDEKSTNEKIFKVLESFIDTIKETLEEKGKFIKKQN